MRSSRNKNAVDGGPGSAWTLAELPPLVRACVVAVLGDDALASRLADQGLWPGVELEVRARAPGGDPLLVLLHGYRLALRRDEAARVQIARAEPR